MSAKIGAVVTEEVDRILNTAENMPEEDRVQLAQIGGRAAIYAVQKASGDPKADENLEIERVAAEQLAVAQASRVSQAAIGALIRILLTAATFAA